MKKSNIKSIEENRQKIKQLMDDLAALNQEIGAINILKSAAKNNCPIHLFPFPPIINKTTNPNNLYNKLKMIFIKKDQQQKRLQNGKK